MIIEQLIRQVEDAYTQKKLVSNGYLKGEQSLTIIVSVSRR